ncbi:LytR family transcriptional regulator [bacterium]|nr:MAG: LytR family transcriptional regulator [bacterium]
MEHVPVQNQDAFGKQLDQKKKGRFWKNLGWACLLVAVSGAAVGAFTTWGRETVEVSTKFIPAIVTTQQNPNIIFDNVGDSRVNILVVGQDRNWKQGEVFDPTIGKKRRYQVEDTDTRPRSDTMIICSLDRVAGTMRLISLPRDTRIRYRTASGERHRAVKLNSVYAQEDGENLLRKVMREEFGVRIDRIAKVKLDGFTKLVDRVGGITVNVEGAKFGSKRTRMKYEDKWGGWKVDLMPGVQKLNGEQAHGYVRFRMDNEGDPGRVRRQQQVMRALAKDIKNISWVDMPGLATDALQMFDTDMTNEELVSAAKFAHSLGDPSKISPLTPYGVYAENGDIILNKPDNIKLFKAIFGSSFDPNSFLVLSPETKSDDIGRRNNGNPAALMILKEAGLVDADAATPKDANFEAPGLQ